MEDFTQMRVFFLVTTISVATITLLFALALFYVVRILRALSTFTDVVLDETTLLRGDIAGLRDRVRAEGAEWKIFSNFARKIALRFWRKKHY